MSSSLFDLQLAANARVFPGLTAETLRQWIAEYRVGPDDLLREVGRTDWQRAGDHPQFALLFLSSDETDLPAVQSPIPNPSPARPDPARIASPSSSSSPATPRSPAPVSSPAGAAARPAPKPGPARPAASHGKVDPHHMQAMVTNDLGIAEPAHRRPRRKRPLEDSFMDMTPMIDVTFQLLIFFMFSNQLANPNPIEVPEAVYGRGVTPDGKQIVLVDDQGQYFLGENTKPENVSPSIDALVNEVQQNAENAGEALEVIISAHKNVQHRHVRTLVERLEELSGIGPIHLGVEEKQ